MRETVTSFLFAVLALCAIIAAVMHDDSAHMSADPHHLSE